MANEPLRAEERIGTTSRARTATDLESLLSRIASGAAERDAHPTFPEEPFRELAAAGILAMPAPDAGVGSKRRASFAEEWRVLRAVARADGSVGRILDGHFNGVERVSVLAPEPLRSKELTGRRRRAPAARGLGRGPHTRGRGHRPGSTRRPKAATHWKASRHSAAARRASTARSWPYARRWGSRRVPRCSRTLTSPKA